MLRFPVPSGRAGLPLPRMTLLEYARFSERCLKSNPAITAENCMTRRVDEVGMFPVSLAASAGHGKD